MILFPRSRVSCLQSPVSLKGFTLVEVLTVVVILAILASLIIPRLTSQNEKAIAAEAINIMGTIKRSEFRFFDETGGWFAFATHCVNLNNIIQNLELDLSDSCGGRQAWEFSVTTVPAKIRAARWDAGAGAATANTLIYCLEADPNPVTGCALGQWTGTNDFAPGAANWPNLD